MKLISISLILFAYMILYYAHSLGALLTSILSMIGIVIISFFGQQRPMAQKAMFSFILFIVVAAIIFVDIVGLSNILIALGKDPTLTGRTTLWTAALQQIEQNPLLGLGYQAFWRQGFAPAEHLWWIMGIHGRAGFHFHNLYFNTAVDLGFVGFLIICIMMLRLIFLSLNLIFYRLNDKALFAIGCFSFLFIRSFEEVDLTYQFAVGTLLFCILWSYFGQARINILDAAKRARLRRTPWSTKTLAQ
jgi:exopolysaccharide production protein ExoQ